MTNSSPPHILIVSFGHAQYLDSLLPEIRGYFGAESQVSVVENSPSPAHARESEAAVLRHRPVFSSACCFIYQQDNPGYSATINTFIEQLRATNIPGDSAVFVFNADISLFPETGSSIEVGPNEIVGFHYRENGCQFTIATHVAGIDFFVRRLSRWGHRYIPGCGFGTRLSTFDLVGSFDDRYFLYYEEVDWMSRAGASNVQLRTDPTLLVEHAGTSCGRRSRAKEYHVCRSSMIFHRRWRPAAVPAAVISRLLRSAARSLRSRDLGLFAATARGLWAGATA